MSSDRRTRIREIKDLLQSGVTSTSNDGQSTTFDHETLRTELRLLEEQEGVRRRRPQVYSVFLG